MTDDITNSMPEEFQVNFQEQTCSSMNNKYKAFKTLWSVRMQCLRKDISTALQSDKEYVIIEEKNVTFSFK